MTSGGSNFSGRTIETIVHNYYTHLHTISPQLDIYTPFHLKTEISSKLFLELSLDKDCYHSNIKKALRTIEISFTSEHAEPLIHLFSDISKNYLQESEFFLTARTRPNSLPTVQGIEIFSHYKVGGPVIPNQHIFRGTFPALHQIFDTYFNKNLILLKENSNTSDKGIKVKSTQDGFELHHSYQDTQDKILTYTRTLDSALSK